MEKGLFKIPDELIFQIKIWLNKNPPIIMVKKTRNIDIFGNEILTVDTWPVALSLDISSSVIKIFCKLIIYFFRVHACRQNLHRHVTRGGVRFHFRSKVNNLQAFLLDTKEHTSDVTHQPTVRH